MNPFALLERLIEEHGAASIQGKHLALLRDELAVRDRKNGELEQKIADLEATNRQLKTELESVRPVGPKGDKCPYCQQEKGALKSLDPHPQSLLEQLGHKVAK